ncbi:MAG: PBP1A family penicillin-binding protein, partial [candidate division WOR-3 bacterium]
MKRAIIKPIWLILFILSFCLGLLVGAIRWLMRDLPPASSIASFRPPEATMVYDIEDRFIGQFFIERRRPVELELIPKNLQQAFIALEDRRFYQHWGLNIWAISRAVLTNFFHHRVVQGASTITQQLARNMFLTQERSVERKLKEAILALQIERLFTKDEILEMYLNQVNFGEGAYGVEAAAQTYFGKSVSDLSLSECALLAGIPRSPAHYSPFKNLEMARRRRDLVLQKMYECDFITAEELTRARQEKISVRNRKDSLLVGSYFLEEVRQYLELKYGYDFLYRSGASVYTTMDIEIQKKAEAILEKGIKKIEEDYHLPRKRQTIDSTGLVDSIFGPSYLQGAMVVLDPHTGFVKAMIGGRDFNKSKFNRATQARRQAGSAFKVFVFTSAFDNGFTASDIVLDAPIVIDVPAEDSIYRPSNYDRQFMGPMTLRRALMLSRNLVAIRLMRTIGPELVIDYAHRMGIKSKLLPVLSLALGACEVNLLEMTSAFGVIDNQGIRVEPVIIRKIVDRDGNIIEKYNQHEQVVLTPEVAYVILHTMRSVIDGGTAYRIRQAGFTRPAAGKTGTTNNYTDCWFIGFTPELVAGIWIGYDNNERIYRGATGGDVAAPIWGEFMKAVLDTAPVRDFVVPEKITIRRTCNKTGLLATPYCPRASEEAFIKGTEPSDSCNLHNYNSKIEG